MKPQSIFSLICMLLFCAYSCTPPADEEAPAAAAVPALDLTQVKAEIQAMEDAYAAGLAAKDAEAVVAYYADDAVSMGNNEPSSVGKAAILERIKADIAADTTGGSVVFEVQEIMAAGDYIIEVGKSTSTDADGNQTNGKYVSILEKRNGKYVCIRDIYNEDAPSGAN